MREFLLKLWRLTVPYRGRLLLGILLGIVGGLFEPLMIATVVLVYGLIFPDAPAAGVFFEPKDIKDAPALLATLRQPDQPLARFLWEQAPPQDRQDLLKGLVASNELASVLARDLNYSLLYPSLCRLEFFAGVKLSADTRLLLAENPQGEKRVRLNRLLLSDAYPQELARLGPSPLLSQLRWAPERVRDWLGAAQQAFLGGVRAHPGLIAAMVGLIPLVIVLRGLFSYLNIYLLQWVAIRAVTDLRARLFEHLINLSVGFFSRMRTGELMSRITSDTNLLQGIISNAIPVMVKDPVTLLSLLAYLFWQQPRITCISLVVMPLCMVPVLVYNRKVRRSARALQTQAADLGNVMAESFSGVRVVKGYGLEQSLTQRFRLIARNFIGHYMRIVRSMEIPGPLLEFVGALGVSLVLLYLLTQAGHRPTGSDFLAVILSIFSMYRPLKNLTRLYNTLEQARAASERVFELLATRNEIAEPTNPKTLHAAGQPIEFVEVRFSYGDKPVLHDINLAVQPGQLVALVGPSGSGKTTLTNLLLRFYDPQAGAVRIGGVDLRQFATAELRRQIALVTQETILFNETLAQNIALGRPGATQAEIEAAAKHAYAHKFILEKPQGYDTLAGEKGSNLSGGQRQRLAIARAILKNAPILILDEATSALDTESERVVQAALEELMEGRTTICIAHRLSTIQKADLIIVFDQGRIVETGTHAELIQRQGLYRKLHELQFEPTLA